MTAAVRTTPQADASIIEAAAWWRANRAAAPDLFEQELSGAVALLAGAPDVGRRYRHRGIPGLRRLLLPRVRYHVYYVHHPERGEVVVLVVWSAVRGRGPRISRLT